MIPGSANPLLLKSAAAAAGGYQIERSLRFNFSDSAYLSRTPASAGNRKTWTWAGWVKKTANGQDNYIFDSNLTSNHEGGIKFMSTSPDRLEVWQWSGSTVFSVQTTAVLRDNSAWYHIVVNVDTTQATSTDRVKIYINNQQAAVTGTFPTLNYDTNINAAVTHAIGRWQGGAARYLDGYLADIHFIDGQALDPTSFTEVSATTGQLIPKAYTGTFGTNGFWLKFSDNSAATAAALGKDYSGNSNNWTPNNLSVTAGAGNDSLVDTPTSIPATDTGVGGVVRGNYATLLDQYVTDKTRLTMANGNLDVTFNNSVSSATALSSIAVRSGKWYAEFTCTQTGSNYAFVGIASTTTQNNNIESLGYSDTYAYISNTGNKANNASFVSYAATWTANDVIGVALDLDAGTLTFYKNGASQGQAYSSISGTYVIGCTGFLSWKFSANFGQRAFAYTAPAGFKALCDTNLPAPLVAKPSTVFDVITYTGTGSSLTLPNGSSTPTSISFTPDFAWLKGRSGATNHALYDAVRGVQKDLVSNSTSAETTETTGLTAFGTNTFTVGSLAKLNTSSSTYVAWCWDAGTTTASNPDGSITSQVRANASAGFSVVTYTGNATAGATVGHGLGVAPALIINKQRSGTNNWWTYHASLGATKYLVLDATNAVATANTVWNDTAPTSTVFSIGVTGVTNTNSATYVTYCFAPVTGYSSMGSYVGNGSSDGPFVYTGFRPKFLLFKSAGAGDWVIIDATRDIYNVSGYNLYPNDSVGESFNARLDILSNGFKLRSTFTSTNPSGTSVVYAAFAESPFQYARAR